MKFFIEQVAICPKDPQKAKDLLKKMGALDWVVDKVNATGYVNSNPGSNVANLSFNYDLIQGKEFEILDYVEGDNWIEYGSRENTVCHLGMHCSPDELNGWREFFAKEGIKIAQEVFTQSHTNVNIQNKRRYNYVIFDTKSILGVDLKFIVRINLENDDDIV